MLTLERATAELPLIAILCGLDPPRAVGVAHARLSAGFRAFPVSGISPESMQARRDAGASGFGLGSALFRPAFSDGEIAARARRFVSAWR